MSNRIVWVDIPVLDLERAIAFYSAIFGVTVTREGGPGFIFGLLPHAKNEVGGCLYIGGEENAPSRLGPVIYLNMEGRLQIAIEAAIANGGAVMQEVHPIGSHGFRAVMLDSEGNRIAFHSSAL